MSTHQSCIHCQNRYSKVVFPLHHVLMPPWKRLKGHVISVEDCGEEHVRVIAALKSVDHTKAADVFPTLSTLSTSALAC